jgi:hypothetical protein
MTELFAEGKPVGGSASHSAKQLSGPSAGESRTITARCARLILDCLNYGRWRLQNRQLVFAVKPDNAPAASRRRENGSHKINVEPRDLLRRTVNRHLHEFRHVLFPPARRIA